MRKGLVWILAVLLLASSLGLTAYAESLPQRIATVTVEKVEENGKAKDKVTVVLVNGCETEDNFLEVRVRTQYHEDDHYYWYPAESACEPEEPLYAYMVGYNTDTVTTTLAHKGIEYVHVWVKTRWGEKHAEFDLEHHVVGLWTDNGVRRRGGYGTTSKEY